MTEHKKMAFKVIVIGDPSVGKTSLIRRYSDDKFDSSYLPTIGADFNLKIVELQDMEVVLTIWDIGGHDRFGAIRSFYYQGSHAGVLVLDRSRKETYESIPKWKEDLEKGAKAGIPCVLMANKSDLPESKLIPESEISELASKLGVKYFLTSAKDGTNVAAAFEELAKQCAETFSQ
ncbi:MAG: Rab family GTPase [Candidatus Helarchaeales archaeon]